MVYRTAGMIDARIAAGNCTDNEAFTEYTVECSILKVYGSEMNQFAADELVATMGGYGYVEEFAAERLYRDARINRIFEGTNEINRLIVSGWMLKRAVEGKLPLMKAIQRTLDEAMAPPSFEAEEESGDPLAREARALKAVKQMALFAAGVASQRFMAKLDQEQEIMGALSAMIAEAFALESALLRARKLAGKAMAELAQAMTGLLAERSLEIAAQAARLVLAASAEGDEQRMQLAILRRLARVEPANVVELSRRIARAVVQAGRYPLG
jgi:butyryl-CoA dehydrogenase